MEIGYATLVFYTDFVQEWSALDHELYDIPPLEELQSLQFRERSHLRIDRLDDMQARKMTRFAHK